MEETLVILDVIWIDMSGYDEPCLWKGSLNNLGGFNEELMTLLWVDVRDNANDRDIIGNAEFPAQCRASLRVESCGLDWRIEDNRTIGRTDNPRVRIGDCVSDRHDHVGKSVDNRCHETTGVHGWASVEQLPNYWYTHQTRDHGGVGIDQAAYLNDVWFMLPKQLC
jgi:hypothetical protein